MRGLDDIRDQSVRLRAEVGAVTRSHLAKATDAMAQLRLSLTTELNLGDDARCVADSLTFVVGLTIVARTTRPKSSI